MDRLPPISSPLSLHDALPISRYCSVFQPRTSSYTATRGYHCATSYSQPPGNCSRPMRRSEEHTSELQSLTNLVCRLLLEKKKDHVLTDQFIGDTYQFCVPT